MIGDGSDETLIKPLPTQPVHFSYIAVYQVVGFSALSDGGHIEIPLAVDQVDAHLADDPNPPLVGVDESSAVALLMLRGALHSDPRLPSVKSDIDAGIHEIVENRTKLHPVPGVYLVIRASGQMQSTATEISRDLGHAVLAFDAVDKAAISDQYRSLVDSLVSATALTVGSTSAEVLKVTDGVEVQLADGRPLYSRAFVMGSLGVRVTRPASSMDSEAIARRAAAIKQEPRLDTATRLLVDSLGRSNDRLEAFLLAWASLEIIVRKFTKGCEDGAWTLAVPTTFRDMAAKVHEKYSDRRDKEYGLVDRVRVFCMSRGMKDAEEIAKSVNVIRKTHREPLYHEGKLDERKLPVEKVIELVRALTLTLIDQR